VIGAVLGLGWSQVNVNVQTDSPPPTSADYAGFPVMHYTDPQNCVPITICYSNPYQLSMDDNAAISRLYPVTAENQSSFPGKQVFSATTARIYGSVLFTDANGNPTQPMQGVNVVARWIDPSTGLPSRQYAETSVSGFLFTGNAGNPITGFVDALGNFLSDWGSSSSSVEGFFDLSGLAPPNNNSSQYQLTVEELDPNWSAGVGPYSPGPVAPSGSIQPIVVTVTPGNEAEQDILMTSTAQPPPQAASSWTNPAALPSGGDWISAINGYGDVPYFSLTAQANRTLSIAVTALDESGNASQVKAQPVIGMWSESDSQGTSPPAFTPGPFNTLALGETRLDAQVLSATNFLIGISDLRGDGRPDYSYHAHVLYGDSLTPSRIGVNGGAVVVQGIGFSQGLNATVGNAAALQLSVDASQMILAAPAVPDGPQSVTITDPVSGASTTLIGALTFGAAATDNIVLLNGSNPSTPVGAQAPYPMSVRVLAADGVTPVGGATIGWSGTNNVQLSACGGAPSCSVTSDQNGDAFTWLTPTAIGASTITATLAPGIYNPSKSVSATLNATESASNIGVLTPYLWISQGATVTVPLTAIVLGNGTPQNNVQVNFTILKGSGTLSSANAQTNSSGYATVNLTVSQLAALVQVSACVAPGNSPCGIYYANPVPLAQQNLQQIAGAGQILTAGQAFQPVVVRVMDSSSPPNSVLGAPVNFLTTVLLPNGANGSGMPVILQVTQTNATSDINGLASVTPSGGSFSPPIEVDVLTTAGTTAVLNDPLEIFPMLSGQTDGTGSLPVRGAPVLMPTSLNGAR
jgi:hypothetical protein